MLVLLGCIATSICFPHIFKPSEDIDKYQRPSKSSAKSIEAETTEIFAQLSATHVLIKQAVQPHDEMMRGWAGVINRLRGHVDAGRPLYPEHVNVLVDMLDYITRHDYHEKWNEIMDGIEADIHSILHDDVVKGNNKSDGAKQN